MGGKTGKLLRYACDSFRFTHKWKWQAITCSYFPISRRRFSIHPTNPRAFNAELSSALWPKQTKTGSEGDIRVDSSWVLGWEVGNKKWEMGFTWHPGSWTAASSCWQGIRIRIRHHHQRGHHQRVEFRFSIIRHHWKNKYALDFWLQLNCFSCWTRFVGVFVGCVTHRTWLALLSA